MHLAISRRFASITAAHVDCNLTARFSRAWIKAYRATEEFFGRQLAK